MGASLQCLTQLLGRPLPQSDLLPETFDFRLDHEYICTEAEDVEAFKKKYPLWGMPYALPGLAGDEQDTIVDGLRQGARITPKPPMAGQALRNSELTG